MADSIICRLEALEAQPDLDQQTLSVDCYTGELTISGGNSIPLDALGVASVYRLSTEPPGVNARIWNGGDGDAVPHDTVADIWTGPGDPDHGFPTHPNPPTAQVVELDWTMATNVVGGVAYPSDGTDQFEAWGWINTIGLGDVLLRDNNLNTGERGEVWIGVCCGNPTLQPGGNQVDTNGTDRVLLDPVLLPEGVHFVYTRISDLSAFAGIQLQYTTDLSGAAGWLNFPAARSTVTKPVVECQQVAACDLPVDGWDTCPPPACSAPPAPIIAADSADPVLPATVAPIPDNEVDTAIRTGLVGTSVEYARADHNHPIRRQAVVSPALTPGGTGVSGTLIQSIITDRWSTEETVGVEWRAYIEQPAGVGWFWLTVPALAGFQQPQITVGTYRNQSTAVHQDDGDGNGGASPQGPFMGAEAAHWSSTRRVYMGFYRKDQAYRMYVMIRAEWARL